MDRLFRWIVGVGLSVMALAIMLLSPEDLGLSEPDQQVGNVREKPPEDQVMNGVHLVETSEGEKEWELWGERAVNFKGRGNWNVEQVNVLFFGDQGNEVRVIGDRGIIEVESKDMFIEGNVRTTTSNKYVAYTDAVTYKSEARELVSDRKVRMVGPPDADGHRLELIGIGLLAKMANSHMLLRKDVRGKKNLDQDRVVHIQSESAEMSGVSREAVFKGQVEMDFDTLKVTGPLAKFRYASEANTLESIDVEGGVKVSDADKFATSERLEIRVPLDKYIFRGSPRVIQNNDEIRGREIVFLNGGKQVQVLSGKGTFSEKRSESSL